MTVEGHLVAEEAAESGPRGEFGGLPAKALEHRVAALAGVERLPFKDLERFHILVKKRKF